MKRHLFSRRLAQTPYNSRAVRGLQCNVMSPRRENFRKILAAGDSVDGTDLCRIHRSHVGGTYVAIYRSAFTLAEAGHFYADDRASSVFRAERRSRDRVRDSCGAALACDARRNEFPHEDVDLVHRGLVCVRNFCGK